MGFFTEQKPGSEESASTYTLRGITPLTDTYIATQAKASGKPKGTYAREFIEEQLGNPVSSYIRSNSMIRSMDEEIAEFCGAVMAHESLSICLSVQESDAYRALLGIQSDKELTHILFDNAAYLHSLAAQTLKGRTALERGISLKLALFCEMAGRNGSVVDAAWKQLFFSARPDAYEKYMDEIDAVREQKKIAPLSWTVIHAGPLATVKLRQPAQSNPDVWRVQIVINDSFSMPSYLIEIPPIPSRMLVADPGFSGVIILRDGQSRPAMNFINGRCELHLYSIGVAEADNPVPADKSARFIWEHVENQVL